MPRGGAHARLIATPRSMPVFGTDKPGTVYGDAREGAYHGFLVAKYPRSALHGRVEADENCGSCGQ